MFKTLANSMMNGTAYANRITYAPDGFGGAGADEETFDEIPGSDNDGEDDDEQNNDSSDKDEITNDPEKFMSDLFGAGDDDGDDDEDDESPEDLQKAQETMATNLKTGLSGLTLPADLIPEDFDASDPKQLAKVLNDLQIHTATQTIKLVFGPVQETLNRGFGVMRKEMRQTSRDGHSRVAEQSALRAEFPGIDNPVVSPAIKFAYESAKKKHPDNQKAAFSATKKALQTLGITGWDQPYKKGGRDQSESGGSFREGTSALDGLGLRLPDMTRRMRKPNK